MTRINVELLDKIERQITEHPETWRQGDWFILPEGSEVRALAPAGVANRAFDPPCGTAYCVAGWAVVLSGYRLSAWGGGGRSGMACVTPSGNLQDIYDAARELLGLDDSQAGDLFDGGNELGTLLDIFAELRAEAE